MKNRQVVVAQRSAGVPGAECFSIIESEMPVCPEGGLLVEVLLATADPGMRGAVNIAPNWQSVPIGAVMFANGIGRVIESRHPDWTPGDHAYGDFGWQRYAEVEVSAIRTRVDLNLAPAEKWTSALGLNGLAAWVGFNLFAAPQKDQTIVVTTAAGSVGSIVGQLARAAGMRTVGITGGPDKCAQLTELFGYDAAIDYRAEADLGAAIAQACPKGVDILFDSVAGDISDAVFDQLNAQARIVQCGTASIANWLPVPTGPRRERAVLSKRLRWSGFIVMDHMDRYEEARSEIAALLRTGAVVTREHILDGIEHLPGAIAMLYQGQNNGRLLVRL